METLRVTLAFDVELRADLAGTGWLANVRAFGLPAAGPTKRDAALAATRVLGEYLARLSAAALAPTAPEAIAEPLTPAGGVPPSPELGSPFYPTDGGPPPADHNPLDSEP